MKKLIFSMLIALSVVSCSEEYEMNNVEQTTWSEEQLEKISYGCELYTGQPDEKLETEASPEYMQMLSERLASNRQGSTLKAFEQNLLVGVIKEKTCGKYDEIHIVYDTEDHDTKNQKEGYARNISWEYKNNVNMRFCLVPAYLFTHGNTDYAVVEFNSGGLFAGESGHCPEVWRVYMDAEDHNPCTKIFYVNNGKG